MIATIPSGLAGCTRAISIVIRQDGRIVGEHRRSFGRGETIYDPWHYVPVLAHKPGALRNGAPFKDWVLPAAIERVRRGRDQCQLLGLLRTRRNTS
jgi:hypothetical protein